MIRFQNLVPDYYPEQSRDFQVLCRLYDYTFNALKYNIDTMQSLTDTKLVKDTMLPLVGDKFGIYDKQSYSNRQLLEALPNAVHYKGSLKSIKILLNAYLDSKNIFDYAIAYSAKDKESAEEISEILSREIKPYTLVIVLSTLPKMLDLHVLNEYLKMVVPCGIYIEYIFGITDTELEKFKYMEDVFIYYNKENTLSQAGKIKITATDVSSIEFGTITPKTHTGFTPEDKEETFIANVADNLYMNTVGNAIVGGANDN